MRKFFVYARGSSQEQADRDLSIPAQLRAIRKYALEEKIDIASEFVDVERAKEPGRKNFTAMLNELRCRPEVAGVISHKLDRLLRNLKDYAEVDDLMRAGKQFLFATESYDDSASGKLALGVRVLFAKHYLDNLPEETRKGLNERMLERGKWSFIAPLGYLNINGEVKPDPERAPLIRRAFELYATRDWSLREITDYLYAQGLRTRPMRRSETGRFVESRVHAMLRNPFYCGLMRYKGQVIRGTHEPLISKVLFDQVQAALDRMEKARKRERWFMFRGLLSCGECGRAITAEFKKGRYTYYRCTKSGGGAKSCGQAFVREEALIEQLAQQIRPIQLDEDELGILKAILKTSHADEQRYRDAQLGRLNRLKNDLLRKQDTLLDRLIDGTVPKELYDVKHAAIAQELEAVEVAIFGHDQANKSWFAQAEHFLELAGGVHQVFETGGPREKREVVQFVASNGVLTDRKVRLNLKRPAQILADRESIPYGVTDGI